MRLGQLITTLEANRKLQGRTEFRGLKISIENRKGSVRQGVNQDGTKWRTKMYLPYGYIRKTLGVDGDHVDCFIGPDEMSPNVYIVHIQNPDTGEYDEDKCMLGFKDMHRARTAFLNHYDNPNFLQSIDEVPFEQFKKMVLGTRTEPMKITASSLLGQQVVVRGIQYRGTVVKIKGRRLVIEYKGAMNEPPFTITRLASEVTPIGDVHAGGAWFRLSRR